MRKYLKIILVIIIGLFFGLLIHGVVEILAIWILLHWLKDFFLSIPWNTWVLIHAIFAIMVEILGIALAFWILRNMKDNNTLKKQKFVAGF